MTTNNEGYRYISVAIDNSIEFGSTKPLKNINNQALPDEFLQVKKHQSVYTILLKLTMGRNTSIKNSMSFWNWKKSYSRYTSRGAVFSERLRRTKNIFLMKPVSEKRNASWITELLSRTTENNNTIHHPTKMKPIDAFEK